MALFPVQAHTIVMSCLHTVKSLPLLYLTLSKITKKASVAVHFCGRSVCPWLNMVQVSNCPF